MSEIAKELRVEMLLEGSVRYDGDRIRVTAQLIDGETETHLWVEEYEGDLADIFSIQASIASRIAEALEVQLSPGEQIRMAASSSVSPEATALYFKALTVSNIADTLDPGGAGRGTPFIDEALRLDPNFAQAHALKAEFYAVRRQYGEAVEAATRALELDPDLPVAYVALGRVHALNWRGGEARAAFERTLELSPNNTRFLQEYSRLNSYLNRHDAALNLAKQAVNLDPSNPNAYIALLRVHAFAGDAEAAHDVARTLREVAPEDSGTYRYSGLTEIMVGNQDEALIYLRRAERLSPGIGNSAAVRLAYAFRLGGSGDDALRLLSDDVEPLGNYQVAYHLALGNEAEALAALRADVDNRTSANFPLLRVRANIWQDPVLDQPEFQELRDQLVFED